MKLIKTTLAMTLSSLLVACGGGGSDGYYNDQSNNSGNTPPPTTPSTDLDEAQLTLNALKQEGQFLFGNYDATDATTAKGYIDHALDTFAQGPLQLAIDTKKPLIKIIIIFSIVKMYGFRHICQYWLLYFIW